MPINGLNKYPDVSACGLVYHRADRWSVKVIKSCGPTGWDPRTVGLQELFCNDNFYQGGLFNSALLFTVYHQ